MQAYIFLSAFVPAVLGSTYPFSGIDSLTSSCPINVPASCQNSSTVGNLCCFEAPGGLLLQTQFWDTNPPTGPSDSWTIHGLWPDNCDGTFESSCDRSRAYTSISKLLTNQGAEDTLGFMQKFWLAIDGHDEKLWEHEWAKHGTCMSTLKRNCLPNGSPKGAEAVLYFRRVVELFQTLPTYTWLENEGIVPDASKTYSRSTLESALQRQSGGITPSLDCEHGALNGIGWAFNLKGSAIDGTFIPIDAPKQGSCPAGGIKYPPKNGNGDDDSFIPSGQEPLEH